MSRSELVIQLARAGAQNDHPLLERTVAAMVAEARAKQHHALADRLAGTIGSREPPRSVGGTFLPETVRELIVEKPSRRAVSELVLPSGVETQIIDLLDEHHRADVLRAHSLDPRHKVMLVGPPGNGKTTLAEGIAHALAVPFFVVRYEAVVGSYLGETAARLKRVFDFARTTPCVLFLDEFDALGKERGDTHETGEIKRVVSSLLMQIDDLPSYTVVVCATNHPELLDRAVWRRFQLRLELPTPSKAQMLEWLIRVGVTAETVGLAPARLATQLAGASFAEAEEFLLDIKRKLVLSGERAAPSELTQRLLKVWKNRFALKVAVDGGTDGGEWNDSANPAG